jgi:hypothetical protein
MIKEAIAVLALSIILLFVVLFYNKKENILPYWVFIVLYYILCGSIVFLGAILLMEVCQEIFALV